MKPPSKKFLNLSPAEGIAIQACLTEVIELGFFNFEVESDSIQVVMKIKNPQADDSELGWIVKDIIDLTRFLKFVNFLLLSCSCNRVALDLARMVVDAEIYGIWLEECPSPILSVWEDDYRAFRTRDFCFAGS